MDEQEERLDFVRVIGLGSEAVGQFFLSEDTGVSLMSKSFKMESGEKWEEMKQVSEDKSTNKRWQRLVKTPLRRV